MRIDNDDYEDDYDDSSDEEHEEKEKSMKRSNDAGTVEINDANFSPSHRSDSEIFISGAKEPQTMQTEDSSSDCTRGHVCQLLQTNNNFEG